jgi:hypothetical protein
MQLDLQHLPRPQMPQVLQTHRHLHNNKEVQHLP